MRGGSKRPRKTKSDSRKCGPGDQTCMNNLNTNLHLMKRAKNQAMRKGPEIEKCREALAPALLGLSPLKRLTVGSGIGCNYFSAYAARD